MFTTIDQSNEHCVTRNCDLSIALRELVPADEMASKRKPRFSNESADYAKQNRDLPPGPEMLTSWRLGGPNGGEVGLVEMFGPHDTLVLYHWMFGPERTRPCPIARISSALAANAADLKERVALAVVSRSRVERMVAFGIERGWRGLPYYQAIGDDFSIALGTPQRGRPRACARSYRTVRRSRSNSRRGRQCCADGAARSAAQHESQGGGDVMRPADCRTRTRGRVHFFGAGLTAPFFNGIVHR